MINLYGFAKAWKAEWSKLKNSGITLFVIVVAIFFPMARLISKLTNISTIPNSEIPYSFFRKLLQTGYQDICSVFFPMFIVMLAAMLAQVENKNDSWKLLECQPISKLSIYFNKWLVAACLLGLIILIFLVSLVLAGYIQILFKGVPENSTLFMPWSYYFQAGVRLWIASLGVLTLQLILSLLIGGFAWPVSIGIAAIVTTMILSTTNVINTSFHIYSLPGRLGLYPSGSEMGYWLLPSEKQSLLWVCLLLPIGFAIYKHKGVLNWLNSGMKSYVFPIAFMVIFGLGSWYIQTPKQMPLLTNRTVFAGNVTSTSQIDSIKIVSKLLEKQIAAVSVNKNGDFYINTQFKGDVQEFAIVASGKGFAKQNVFVGTGDSLYIKWEIGNNGAQKTAFSGTAISTNQFISNKNSRFSFVRTNVLKGPADLLQPKEYYQSLIEEWKARSMAPKKFKTADGIGLSPIVRRLQEKLIAVEYLELAVFIYPERYQDLYPDKKFTIPWDQLSPLLTLVPEFDSSLVGWENYNLYFKKWLLKDLAPTANKDSFYLSKLLSQAPGITRDLLLYDHTKAQLDLTRDSLERASLIQKQVAAIQDQDFKTDLLQRIQLLNSMRTGQKAPAFAATDLSNKKVSFDDLKGKFIVIDVWATWCGPCRYESPIFESLSQKYKEYPIHFLSISVDQQRDVWVKYLEKNPSKTLQWHASDKTAFGKVFGITGIPRFMLLDKDGRMINNQVPEPSNRNFESILRDVLQLAKKEG